MHIPLLFLIHVTLLLRALRDHGLTALASRIACARANPLRPAGLNMSGVVFVESLPSPWLIGFIARFLYITDMVSSHMASACHLLASLTHTTLALRHSGEIAAVPELRDGCVQGPFGDARDARRDRC